MWEFLDNFFARRAVQVLSIGITLLLVAGSVVVSTRGNDRPARVLGERLVKTPDPVPAPTVTVTLPSTIVTLEPVPEPDAPEPEATSSPAGSIGSSTSTSLVCRNSTNSRCGRFFWDPAPAKDKPLQVDVVMSPGNPQVGDVVTFTVTVTDGDAPVSKSVAAGYGDPSRARLTTCSAPARYGPWTPPTRQSGSFSTTFQHTYSAAGDYLATFVGRSGDCGSPYGGQLLLELPLTVDEEPEPDPSPAALYE